jgi:hypothetical protein
MPDVNGSSEANSLRTAAEFVSAAILQESPLNGATEVAPFQNSSSAAEGADGAADFHFFAAAAAWEAFS